MGFKWPRRGHPHAKCRRGDGPALGQTDGPDLGVHAQIVGAEPETKLGRPEPFDAAAHAQTVSAEPDLRLGPLDDPNAEPGSLDEREGGLA